MGVALNSISAKPKSITRDALTLLTSTAAGQMLLMVALPALTRTYSAEQFGFFGVYSAAVSILAVLINLRIDLAVMTATTEEYAGRMAVLSIKCAFVLGLLASLVLVIGAYGWSSYHNELPQLWIVAVPIAAAATAIFNTLCAWHARMTRFRLVAERRFLQVFIMVGLQLVFAWFIPINAGLILGSLLAYLITVVSWLGRTITLDQGLLFRISWKNAWCDILSLKSFSVKAISVDTLSQLLSQLPMVYLGYCFSAQAMGYYTLTLRILGAPVNMLGGAIAEVFRPRVTQAYVDYGNCRELFIKTLKSLVIMMALGSLTLTWFLPDFFTLLFGSSWRESGVYAQILVPVFAFKLLAHPLSYTILLRNRMDIEIKLHLVMLFLLLSIMYACVQLSLPIRQMLLYYAALYVGFYIAYLYYSYKFSLN